MDPWLLEFANWVADKEETEAYAQIFVTEFLPHLPQEIKELILQKYWKHHYKKVLPFGLINAPWMFRRFFLKKRTKNRRALC